MDFPLTRPVFEYQFGVRAMSTASLAFRQTDDYQTELRTKAAILRANRDEVFAATPKSELACRETAAWMVRTVPWVDAATGDDHPLILSGSQVQEDIAVLEDDFETGFPIMAGLVCFPSGWSIADKIGYSIARTHGEVPGFTDQMLQRTAKLFASLKPLRTVDRFNWMIVPSSSLAMLPSDSAKNAALRESVTATSAGQNCYFRVEYQTLTRLPQTGAIVFTILTTRCPLDELNSDQITILAGVIRTVPEAVADYKRITPMRAALREYFDLRTAD